MLELGVVPGRISPSCTGVLPTAPVVFRGSRTLTATFADPVDGPPTITRNGGSWIADGFAVGQQIRVTGSAANNGSYRIVGITATVLTLDSGSSLTAEANAQDVTIALDGQVVLIPLGQTIWVDGGLFGGSYAVVGGVSKVVPVDLHIRGCPPRPTALLAGLLALLEPDES